MYFVRKELQEITKQAVSEKKINIIKNINTEIKNTARKGEYEYTYNFYASPKAVKYEVYKYLKECTDLLVSLRGSQLTISWGG